MLFIFLVALSSASALIAVSPSSYNLNICPGNTFSINISLSEIADVYGFQFDLSYDSNVLEAISVDNGTLLSNNGQYNTFCIQPDLSTSGLIKNVACTRIGDQTSTPSSGLLSIINFRLKNLVSYPKTSNLVLYNVKIVNGDNNSLDNTTQNGQVTIESCICIENETVNCTSSDGCLGIRTCTNGTFGNCTNNPPYRCDANCDGTDECFAHDCTPCECTGSISRSCETSGGCEGRKHCVNGNFTECQITHYYCDFNCDGTNDTCSDDTCSSPCVCVEDWTCEAWSTCSGETQARTCTDENECGTDEYKPSLTKSCSTTSTAQNSGSNSGGNLQTSSPPACTESWSCEEWSSCQPDGFMRRVCSDANSCGTFQEKPQELETCVYEGSCDDGIMNRDELGVDCGGSCPNACAEPEPEQIVLGPPILKITAEPVNAEILDQYVLKVTIENQGQSEADDLSIVASKWSGEPQVIQSIMPGTSEQRELVLSLPPNLDDNFLDIQLIQGDAVIDIQSVPVTLSVPQFSVKINKDPASGRTYESIIVDNRNSGSRTLEVDVTINKGRETYLFDFDKTYDVAENEIFNHVDFLYQDLPNGKYEVHSDFYENGQKVGEATSYVTLSGGNKSVNVQYLFYLLLLVIVGVSGYVFFLNQKKLKGELNK